MSKPNGIEQIIFHNGIFIVRARKKHAHNPIIITPNTYSEISVKHTTSMKPPIMPVELCVVDNSHI